MSKNIINIVISGDNKSQSSMLPKRHTICSPEFVLYAVLHGLSLTDVQKMVVASRQDQEANLRQLS